MNQMTIAGTIILTCRWNKKHTHSLSLYPKQNIRVVLPKSYSLNCIFTLISFLIFYFFHFYLSRIVSVKRRNIHYAASANHRILVTMVTGNVVKLQVRKVRNWKWFPRLHLRQPKIKSTLCLKVIARHAAKRVSTKLKMSSFFPVKYARSKEIVFFKLFMKFISWDELKDMI